MKIRKKQTARKTMGSASPLRVLARSAAPAPPPRVLARSAAPAPTGRRAQYFKDVRTGFYFHRTRRVGDGKLGAWGRARVGTPLPYGICYDGKRFLANACKARCADAGRAHYAGAYPTIELAMVRVRDIMDAVSGSVSVSVSELARA